MGGQFRSPDAFLSRGGVLDTHCGPSGSGGHRVCVGTKEKEKLSVAAGN
jgi:hypothetical protein